MLLGSLRLRGWPPPAGAAAGLELGPQSSGWEGPAALLRSRRDGLQTRQVSCLPQHPGCNWVRRRDTDCVLNLAVEGENVKL